MRRSSGKYGLAACAFVASMAMAGAALAAPVTYSFNTTFNSGTGSLSGQFTFDPSTNTYSNISVSTGAGTDMNSAPVAGATHGHFYEAYGAGELTVGASPSPAMGATLVRFTFSPNLHISNPAIIAATELVCLNAGCTSQSGQRGVTTSTSLTVIPNPAPVPTLSEWAMMLMGTLLAGGTALMLMRRRRLAGV